jgi:hypothetical protein
LLPDHSSFDLSPRTILPAPAKSRPESLRVWFYPYVTARRLFSQGKGGQHDGFQQFQLAKLHVFQKVPFFVSQCLFELPILLEKGFVLRDENQQSLLMYWLGAQ